MTQAGAISNTPEQAFAESLLTLVSRADAGMLILDRQWKPVFANKVAYELAHVRPEDVGTRTIWEIYPGLEGSEIGGFYREVMEHGTCIDRERVYYAPLDVWRRLKIFPVSNGIGIIFADMTAIVRAEQEREIAATTLHEVLESTTDAVVALNREWQFTFLNGHARQLLAPAGEVIGRVVWEAFPETAHEDSPFHEALVKAMEGQHGEAEAFYGAPLNRWYHIVVYPTADGVTVFFHDVTEKKARDEALRSSEERYRILTELSPQAQWTATTDGRVMYANQRFLEYLGRSFVPETGEEYIRCFDPEDRDLVESRWRHSVQTGEDYDLHARLLRGSDGASRWWHLKASPLRDEEGNIHQWLGIATDVHEFLLADRQLRQQYEQLTQQSRMLEAIYGGSPIGMTLYEPNELRVLNLNERQAEIFGVPREEAIGKRFVDLVPHVRESRVMLERAAKGELMLNGMVEGVLPARPNDYRYWNVNYSPIFADDGSVEAVSGATIEITQQKRAEIALIQSEKLAAVGRLAASISHEINNPLEAITNLLYLASHEDISREAQDYIAMAQEELTRVSQIATQTLRFHRQSESPVNVDPGKLIDAVMNLYQGRLANSGVSVERRYRTSGLMYCFENDIRQVLNNLIANAIDAMRSSGGRLIVGAEKRFVSGRHFIAITVADTGTGMMPETVRRLFEPFYTTKGMNGTGLGLWISKEIVDRHGGTLKARSSVHPRMHGTVFQLLLPCEGDGVHAV